MKPFLEEAHSRLVIQIQVQAVWRYTTCLKPKYIIVFKDCLLLRENEKSTACCSRHFKRKLILTFAKSCTHHTTVLQLPHPLKKSLDFYLFYRSSSWLINCFVFQNETIEVLTSRIFLQKYYALNSRFFPKNIIFDPIEATNLAAHLRAGLS